MGLEGKSLQMDPKGRSSAANRAKLWGGGVKLSPPGKDSWPPVALTLFALPHHTRQAPAPRPSIRRCAVRGTTAMRPPPDSTYSTSSNSPIDTGTPTSATADAKGMDVAEGKRGGGGTGGASDRDRKRQHCNGHYEVPVKPP